MPSSTRPRVAFSAERIAARVQALGAGITAALPPGPTTVVGVLKGAFVFTADLARAIDRPLQCDFLGVRSYGDATVSSGVVEITSDLSLPIEDRHVLLVEDIVDTGLTLRYLLDILSARRPASLQVATLLSKPSRRRTEVPVTYVGFECPDEFVVGYGMDAAQEYRNLPYVGVIEADER